MAWKDKIYLWIVNFWIVKKISKKDLPYLAMLNKTQTLEYPSGKSCWKKYKMRDVWNLSCKKEDIQLIIIESSYFQLNTVHCTKNEVFH